LVVFGILSVFGLVIGGFFVGVDLIVGIIGWCWVFFVNVFIGIVVLYVVNYMFNIIYYCYDYWIDWKGVVVLSVVLVLLLSG